MGAGPEAAGGAAPFDPSTIGGLSAWFKADAGTSTTTDGVGISQWNDQSGNARHLTQATGSKQPLYKAAIQNGLPVVRCDGVDDVMLTAAFTIVQPVTLFAAGVFRTAFGAADRVLVEINQTSPFLWLFRANSTDMDIYAGTANVGGASTPQAAHAYTAVFNGASSLVRADGTQLGATADAGGTGVAGGMAIGGGNTNNASADEFGTCDLFEVLLYNTALSVANQQNVEGYLKTRWGTP
jgi:hypothetical protein